MRGIPFLCVLVGLGGCVTASAPSAPDAGAWKIDRGHDRILGKPTASAAVMARSRNARQQERRYPHGQLQLGSLQLLCFDSAPTVRLEFNHRIGSNRTSILSYRFDDGPGRDAEARFLANYSTVLIEEPKEVADFVDRLRVSATLYIRITSHIAGTSSVAFPLKGAPAAIDAAFQACPVGAPSKPRGTVDAKPRSSDSVSG